MSCRKGQRRVQMHWNIGAVLTVINLATVVKGSFTDRRAESTPERPVEPVNKTCWSRDWTTGQKQRRQQSAERWTSGEIPTALTKLRRPTALARLAALRFFLVSFFTGRWCSFAQIGLSLERLTRPRNTRVTNFFIMPLLSGQESQLTALGSLRDGWKHGRRVHRNRAADETWDEKGHLAFV